MCCSFRGGRLPELNIVRRISMSSFDRMPEIEVSLIWEDILPFCVSFRE